VSVRDDAEAWIAQDPDEETRAELTALLDDEAALGERFASRLAFGTAGLRGELGAGPNRMNRIVVAQAAAGFAAWLIARGGHQSVVVGYDGRKNSKVFARDTAEIMAGAGVAVTLFPRAVPTPVLAFAVRHLKSSAGVMVTASHNPAADNGYKVYLGGLDGGSQIVSPADAQIEAAIRAVAPVNELLRSETFELASDEVVNAYVAQTAALRTTTDPAPRFVYTAMHGVGWETARAVFATAGLGLPDVVTEQIEPDPTFPTVAFPNPEEEGALDLSFALAKKVGAELIVANDPDADRLAIAVPLGGQWRRLSGNEVGSLLGWRAALRLENEDATGTGHANRRTLAASIVSSPALKEIARKFNLDYVETLTGFKWISRVGGLAYGFEEALGYLVDPDKVRDKDGISAAVEFLSLAAELKAAGTGFAEHQAAFDERFGAYASSQISIRVTDLSAIDATMQRLRHDPPSKLGADSVASIDDFIDGFGPFSPSNILRMWVGTTARVVVRPSGTEPKLKVYIDAWSRSGSAAERRAAAEARVAELDVALRELTA
jgi:phosphomannomutase